MSDESFFREVNEEIRHDRTRALWTRFGRALIAVAVVAVLATAGFVAWRAYEERQANASGDRYLAALDLASAGNLAEAVTQLEALAADGYGAYPNLARMRIAAVRVAEGNPAAAVEALDGIGRDSKTPQPLRDMAAIRAAYILVDTGSVDDVRSRVERLTGDEDALRFAARETLGLANWKAGKFDAAKTFFEEIRDGGGAPSGIALRAGLMLEMIAAGSLPPSATDPAVEAAPAPASAAPAAAVASEPAAPAVAPLTPATPEAATAPTSAPAAEATQPAAAPAETPVSVPQAPAANLPAEAPAAAPTEATPAPMTAPAPAETPAPAPAAEAPVAPTAPAQAPTAPAETPTTAPTAPATPAVPPT